MDSHRLVCSISVNQLQVTYIAFLVLKQKQCNLLCHLGHQVLKLRKNSAKYLTILNMNRSIINCNCYMTVVMGKEYPGTFELLLVFFSYTAY